MLPVKDFIDFVERHSLFDSSSKILAAVSGGMDSVLMIHLLKSAGVNFGIAHCNFQLRGDESNGDENFCLQLAQQLDVPIHVIHFDTLSYASENKVSTQMAARTLRYQWFEEIRQREGYTAIALAHHQNDTIETILLNLTRGTGIAGLHGIMPKNGKLVRPLLFLSRDEIQQIINDPQIPYREDSSNSSSRYARNKIRLEVIPKLKELNPALEQTFESNLIRFRELEELLELRVAELKQKLVVVNDQELHIALSNVRNIQPQRLLLYNLLKEYGFNESIVDDIISSLDKHSGRTFESNSFKLMLDRDKLILLEKGGASVQAVIINIGDHEARFGKYKLNILHDDSPLIIKDNPMAVSVDADRLVYPLTLRSWQQGDTFTPLGMKGRKKLSDYFISLKIPLHKKEEIPLLVNSNGGIIWIGGYRPDDNYKVTSNTKKVTIFELNII